MHNAMLKVCEGMLANAGYIEVGMITTLKNYELEFSEHV
jgi:hypothetical protein